MNTATTETEKTIERLCRAIKSVDRECGKWLTECPAKFLAAYDRSEELRADLIEALVAIEPIEREPAALVPVCEFVAPAYGDGCDDGRHEE